MCNNTLSLNNIENDQTSKASAKMQPASQVAIRPKGGKKPNNDKITTNTDNNVTKTNKNNEKNKDTEKYPAKAHAKRVADKLKLDNGLILLAGAKTQYYPDSDQPIPFRQDRAFYYLTGCNEPGCYVTYETAKEKLTLWLPKVDEGRRVFYDGRNLNAKEAMEKYDVDEVKIVRGPAPKKTNLRKVLVDHHEAGGEFAFFKLPGHLIGKPLRQKLKEKRKVGLRPAIKQCRLIKDDHEVALIRKANEVTAKAHRNVMNRLHALKSEPEALAVYTRTCLMNHAQEQAYGPIFGAGKNAGQLHYINNDQRFGKAQVLLIDAGAEWSHYASDVTRTLPINAEKPGHWASKEAEMVYKAVAKIQEECIAELAPGKKYIDVSWKAVHMAIDALLEMGVLKGDHMEIFHAGTVLGFFPHGLGHHVGLDVHDGMAPPKDGDKKKGGKKGGKGDEKNGGKKGELKQKKAGVNKVGGKKQDNWMVVEKDVMFDAEKDMTETETENESETDALLTEMDPRPESDLDEKKGNGKGKGRANGKGKAATTPEQAALNSLAPSADTRFARIQGHYRAYATAHAHHAAKMLSQNPAHYSLDPAACHGPNTPSAPALKAGMVVTVEPGLYFNRWILKRQFLNNETHKAFIDEEVLEKFIPVGGVRIEDDILITEKGHENLTTAVKGEEMLKIIKNGAKGGKDEKKE